VKLLKNDFYLSDNDLKDIALNVIKKAKDNNYNSVIKIFEYISLPFSGKNYKKKLFLKIFELANIDAIWDKKMGCIIYSENRTKKTIVSHMDLIPSFNKGFSKGKVYIIEDDKLIGALDNTFTNAVVINSILNKQSKDTTYLFSLDEETSQKAIKSYMKRFGSEQFIFNLDVTNDGKNHHMSIEYDEPCYHICKQINDNLINPFFTTDRVGDDLDKVLQADGKGFSYCLPTEKTIHSYKNFTYLKNIQPYMDGLEYLVHNLNLDIVHNNIDYLDIKEASNFESFEKMKEKDIYNHPRETYIDKNRKVSNVIDTKYGINKNKKENSYIKFFKDFTKNFMKSESFLLDEFLELTFYSGDFFTEDDFSEFAPNDLFYELLFSDIIHNTYLNYYDFNTNIIDSKAFKIYIVLKKYKNINAIEFFKIISDYNIKEFSYEDILDVEKDHKFQNVSEAIIDLISKKYIKKIKDKERFKII